MYISRPNSGRKKTCVFFTKKETMPNGTNSGPKSIQNDVGDPSRRTIRKSDPSRFICRPGPTALEHPRPYTATPPRGWDNGNPPAALREKSFQKVMLNKLWFLLESHPKLIPKWVQKWNKTQSKVSTNRNLRFLYFCEEYNVKIVFGAIKAT